MWVLSYLTACLSINFFIYLFLNQDKHSFEWSDTTGIRRSKFRQNAPLCWRSSKVLSKFCQDMVRFINTYAIYA